MGKDLIVLEKRLITEFRVFIEERIPIHASPLSDIQQEFGKIEKER